MDINSRLGSVPIAGSAAAATTTGSVLARLSLIDREGSAIEIGPIQAFDGRISAVGHLDERKAA